MIYTEATAEKEFGRIIDGVWADEAKFCELLQIPSHIAEAWINSATGLPTSRIYLNRVMGSSLLQALDNIFERGLLSELKTFDGCYEVRDVRGIPGKISCHSYALAIDNRSAEQPLGHSAVFTPAYIQCWKDAGFRWGGDFQRIDAMHWTLGW